MARVLLCADEATQRQLAGTAVSRDAFEVYAVTTVAQGIGVALKITPRLIVVDSELADAEFLVRQLRGRAETKTASIAVVARGEPSMEELGLLDAGVNAVLRLPPNAEWDARIESLLSIPTRKEIRLHVDLRLVAEAPAIKGRVLNLSATGMLVESVEELSVGSEAQFRLELPGFATSTGEVSGRARVVRAAARFYGLQFVSIDEGGSELIRRFMLVP
jgi:DNA-binding response OmpR family regulator